MSDTEHEFPESVKNWLAKTKEDAKMVKEMREANKKTSTTSLLGEKCTISERFWNMKVTQKLIDTVVICADGHQEKLHMDMLSNLGTEFTNYLVPQASHANDVVNKFVLNSSISSEHFQQIVYFAYQNKCELTNEKAIKLGLVAIKMKITPLIDYCIEHMLKACQTLKSADLDTAVNGLYLSSLNQKDDNNNNNNNNNKHSMACKVFKKIIEDNFQAIQEKPEAFDKLSFAMICEMLKSNRLNITSEVIIWQVIEHWVEADLAERLHLLIPLAIQTIRFGRLAKSFIRDTIVASNVFQRQSTDDKQAFIGFIKTLEMIWNQSQKDGYGLFYSKSIVCNKPRLTRSFLLAFGGWIEGKTTPSIEVYDYQTNLWQTSGIKLPKNMSYFALEILDNVVYIFGGSDSRQIFKNLRALKLDDETPHWVEKCSMNEYRCYLASVSWRGQLIAIGGFNRTARSRKCERYDPKTNIWSEMAEMNYARSDASAAVLNGKIYVAGGINDSCIEKTVEIYEPDDNRWVLIMPMNSPRTSFSLIAFANEIWALGGNTGEGRSQTIECYNPSTDTWTMGPSMIDRRSTFKATLFNNNLYVVGGYNGESPISGVEKYVPGQGWSRVKQLKHDRSGLNLLVLPSKNIFEP